jgi:hypothetical protein
MKHTIVFLISIFICASATAARLVRVVGITNVRTIVVDRNSVAANVTLASVAISPDDEAAAVEYLRATLIGSWVLVETNARGESYVYRSPDALFVNGALTRRAYLERGPQMIYLGEVEPGPARAVTRAKPAGEAVSILPPAKPRRAPTSPKGAHRIPRFPPLR